MSWLADFIAPLGMGQCRPDIDGFRGITILAVVGYSRNRLVCDISTKLHSPFHVPLMYRLP